MPRKNATLKRLDEFEERLARMEAAFRHLPGAPATPREQSIAPWKHLVRRPHPWRTQLFLRGKNLTARQLVGGMRANNLDEDQASANYKVPVEAIREALAYVDANKRLLEEEAEIERLMLKREGVSRGPRPVS